MGGIHVMYRETKDTNYVGASSQLVLPKSYGCRENVIGSDGKSYNGAFPEFFHGFYLGDYGLDVGVIYKGGAWRLCLYSFKSTTDDMWYSSSSFTVPTNRTVVLANYFSNGYLVTRLKDSNGNVIKSFDVALKTAAYNTLSKGCEVHRELCIAVNKNQRGVYEVPAKAYFNSNTGVKFSRTTLTKNDGTYVPLTSSNNKLYTNLFDSGIPSNTSHYKSYTKSVEETQSYIADLANATLDKTNCPITAI